MPRTLGVRGYNSHAIGQGVSARIRPRRGLWSLGQPRRDHLYRVTFVVKNITAESYTTPRIISTYIRQQVPHDSERYVDVTVRANFGS